MFKRITFSRTMCYGTCPAFDVEILHDGTVRWNGHMFVSAIGEEEFTISGNRIKKLEALLEEFNYRSFSYPEPDLFATDHPSCITRVEFVDGFVKEVDHYLGDDTTNMFNDKHSLQNLDKFERKIEQIIGLRKYIKSPPLYLFHLRSSGYECVVSAPNQKEAIGLAEYTYKTDSWVVDKIGKDVTGGEIPYIVMDKIIQES